MPLSSKAAQERYDGGGGAGRNTIWKITEIELRCSVTDTIRKERNGVGYPHISGSHVSLHFNQS